MRGFPKLIYVTEEGDDDARYFEVHKDGVASVDEHGKAIAIYQLVKIGTVGISKEFRERKVSRRGRSDFE
jgi:hypothetical protein